MRWRHKTRLNAKSAAIWKIAEFAWFCNKFSDRRIPGGTVRRSLNRADSEKELRASLLLTYLFLSLSAAAHASSNVHTRTGLSGPRPIRPSLSQIGLDHDMSLACLLLNSRETFWVPETFFFFFSNDWTHQCDLRFFLIGTLKKLGRTLEPWYIYMPSTHKITGYTKYRNYSITQSSKLSCQLKTTVCMHKTPISACLTIHALSTIYFLDFSFKYSSILCDMLLNDCKYTCHVSMCVMVEIADAYWKWTLQTCFTIIH